MKNLYSRNLDVVDHVINNEIEKVASIVTNLSDPCKSAYVPSYEEELEHPQKDFAVVLWDSKNGELRKYACYNPELTELNMAFLTDQIETLPEELVKVAATNLTAAAKKFNIEINDTLKKYASDKYCERMIDTNVLTEPTPTMEKKAHFKFALNGRYPIDSPEGIEKAAEWFDKNCNKLMVDEVLEVVDNIKKEAKAQKIEIKNTGFNKYASLTSSKFNDDLYNHIYIRKAQLGDDESNDQAKEAYNEIIRQADELGVEKVAYQLEYIDKEFGLDSLYGHTIVTPIEAAYGCEKQACVEVDGKFITQEMLKTASSSELAEIVGNGLVSDLQGEHGLDIFTQQITPIKQEIARIL